MCQSKKYVFLRFAISLNWLSTAQCVHFIHMSFHFVCNQFWLRRRMMTSLFLILTSTRLWFHQLFLKQRKQLPLATQRCGWTLGQLSISHNYRKLPIIFSHKAVINSTIINIFKQTFWRKGKISFKLILETFHCYFKFTWYILTLKIWTEWACFAITLYTLKINNVIKCTWIITSFMVSHSNGKRKYTFLLP